MSERTGFSLTRWWSIVLKEFTQLRRDRLVAVEEHVLDAAQRRDLVQEGVKDVDHV